MGNQLPFQSLLPQQHKVALQLADRIEAVDQQMPLARTLDADQRVARRVGLQHTHARHLLRQCRQRRLRARQARGQVQQNPVELRVQPLQALRPFLRLGALAPLQCRELAGPQAPVG
ncbi:hypothetical protein D9M69_604580 [compost metagenome]